MDFYISFKWFSKEIYKFESIEFVLVSASVSIEEDKFIKTIVSIFWWIILFVFSFIEDLFFWILFLQRENFGIFIIGVKKLIKMIQIIFYLGLGALRIFLGNCSPSIFLIFLY